MTVRGGASSPEGGRRGMRAHVPVLLPEVLAALAAQANQHFIDATFGAGGYSSALLEAAPGVRVLAIDRDPSAVAAGRSIVERSAGRLTLVQGRFGELDRLAEAAGFAPADGVVLDIGVSSTQLDDPERGFSFQADGPLDMRMSGAGPTAADIVNEAEEADIANILFRLGEERRSRAIARTIVARRRERPFTRTLELAETVERVLGRGKIGGRHPATRTFQALRIHVNDELGELAQGLAAAERVLKPGGRLTVVTFHSLEDAMAKRFLQQRTGKRQGGSRHLPPGAPPEQEPSFRFVNPKPVSPAETEIAINPRARSARLRWAMRTAAPPWPADAGPAGADPSPRRRS
jgi:16S rRNA (cytosine1402-N4)-methyltransferase